MHLFGLGKTEGATDQPLDPRPQIDVLALDFLRGVLAHSMLIGIQMSLVVMPKGSSSVCHCRKTLSFLLPKTYARTLPLPWSIACQSHLGCAFACTKLHISSSSELRPRRTSSSSERQISTSTCAGFKTASTA